MAKFRRVFTMVLLLALLVITTSKPSAADEITEVRSTPRPNKVLQVVRQAGNCPKTVGLWILSFGYRDIAYQSQTIVIADTLAFAGAAELVSSNVRSVEYRSPLQKAYANCVGAASSPVRPDTLEPRYKFQFQKGYVSFSAKLDEVEGFGYGITETKILGLRPYLLVNFID